LFLVGLTLLSVLPCLSPSAAFSRGGGGGGGGGMRMGGGGGFGGYHFGGAGYDGRGTADGWQRGYQGYHPHYGPDSRPALQEGATWKNDQWRTNSRARHWCVSRCATYRYTARHHGDESHPCDDYR
jgi:hypothetical protein